MHVVVPARCSSRTLFRARFAPPAFRSACAGLHDLGDRAERQERQADAQTIARLAAAASDAPAAAAIASAPKLELISDEPPSDAELWRCGAQLRPSFAPDAGLARCPAFQTAHRKREGDGAQRDATSPSVTSPLRGMWRLSARRPALDGVRSALSARTSLRVHAVSELLAGHPCVPGRSPAPPGSFECVSRNPRAPRPAPPS
jgi:hypothetical protein